MYCIDLEETQQQVIKKILNLEKRKPKYDLREIWNAIFYLVKRGCQWRMPPSNFAPWELVYYYRKWSSLGEFDLLLNNLREKVHFKMEQKAEGALLQYQSHISQRRLSWGNSRQDKNCLGIF